MSLYESFDFSEGGIRVAKISFSLERLYYGRIFSTEFGETFFAGFFSRCLFFIGQGEKYTGKNSYKIQVKSGERNTSPQKRWKNEAKRTQAQTYT